MFIYLYILLYIGCYICVNVYICWYIYNILMYVNIFCIVITFILTIYFYWCYYYYVYIYMHILVYVYIYAYNECLPDVPLHAGVRKSWISKPLKWSGIMGCNGTNMVGGAESRVEVHLVRMTIVAQVVNLPIPSHLQNEACQKVFSIWLYLFFLSVALGYFQIVGKLRPLKTWDNMG
jgi:hypothetical protein